MAYPKRVQIVEVGARDGLQNEKKVLPTKTKLHFIELLTQTGLKTIEATSFVRPDRVPQMGDAKELFSKLKEKSYFLDFSFPCLIPNVNGLKNALEVGVQEMALFTATSETFSQKNTNSTIDESLKRLSDVAAEVKKKEGEIRLRGYVSTVFGCPYEGKVSQDNLKKVIEHLLKLGVYQISLGDTTGVGDPKAVGDLLKELKKNWDLNLFAMHFHDTFSLALANITASLEFGIETFDASAGGLGGCPYAQGASGNVATEDVVYLMDKVGIPTGVNMKKLLLASKFILNELERESPSRIHNLLTKHI